MSPRTSQSHPLQIATLVVGRGAIGVTLCPGKKGESVHGAGWDRDLETDLAAIREWGASTIVTLIEPHEFPMLKVEALPQAVPAAGMEWVWWPIRDVSVPDERFEDGWAERGPLLCEQIQKGERVLVHCRGGLGRAGIVAARLLVELGNPPAEAIKQVRAVRPGAIETRAQEAWVLGVVVVER